MVATAKGISVSFVLPGAGLSGGNRTTVEMVTRLRARGWKARLLCRQPGRFTGGRIRTAAKHALNRLSGVVRDSWLPEGTEYFLKLRDVRFEPGELVVAVGSWTIEEVAALDGDVQKLRWCKGFNENYPKEMERLWGLPMATLAVSPPLIPRLEKYAGNRVAGVVPNGVNLAEYFVEGRDRDGVGGILGRGWKKAPEDLISIMRHLQASLPEGKRYVFSTERCPRGLPATTYLRYPSVADARSLYNRAAVWVVVSRSEGFCNPILEAMACGSVVVSTAHDSAPGLIEDETNGFLVPVGDVNAFVEKIRDLWHDPGTLARVRSAGFRTANSFSWDQAVSRMEDALNRVSLHLVGGKNAPNSRPW